MQCDYYKKKRNIVTFKLHLGAESVCEGKIFLHDVVCFISFKVVPDSSAYVKKVTIFWYVKKISQNSSILTKITGLYRAF